MKERDMITQWISWKKTRDGSAFSQKKLAKDAGISPTYLSNIITGVRNPGTKTLERIAGALDITMAEFYDGPDKLVLDTEDDSTRSTADVPGGTDISESTVQEYTAPLPDAAPADGEDKFAQDSEQIGLDSAGDSSGSEAEGHNESEKTGLALSDTSPDQLEKLFDTVGVQMADLFTLPSGKTPELPVEQPEKEVIQTPKDEEKPKVSVASGKIPLLKNAPSSDFKKWFEDNSLMSSSPLISRYGVAGSYVFAVLITNDSMAPDLHKGDVLVINPEDKFFAIEGGIGVVINNERFITRKIYIHKGDYLLIPSNSSYKMNVSPIDETQIFKIALRVHVAQGKF
ncbi:helix-turn-helix domain-containing protein [Candidatus Latescibacterota bacterium]